MKSKKGILLLILSFLLLAGFECIAQQNQLPEKGDYIIYDHLKAYEGRWEYKKGKETFVLTLTLQKNLIGNDTFYVYMDQLEGEVELINKNKDFTKGKQPGYVIKSKTQTEEDIVELIFSDPINQKSGELTLQFVNKNHNLLQWELNEHTELLVRSINKKHVPSFSIPTKMLLRRVE